MTVGAAVLVRYRLPHGDAFTIDVSMHERVLMDAEVILDLEVEVALDCEVVETDASEVVIAGRMSEPRISGTVLGAPPGFDVAVADRPIRVRKGLDGTVHHVEGAEGSERFLGGLTVANGLRFLAPTFPAHPLRLGQAWTSSDVWRFSGARSPLPLHAPASPRVDVTYDYTLASATEASAKIDVGICFEGRSEAMGVDGEGTGSVEVDLVGGKLTSSWREAAIRFRPSRGTLPELTLLRRGEAGVRR